LWEQGAAQFLHAEVRRDLLLPRLLHRAVRLPCGLLYLREIQGFGCGYFRCDLQLCRRIAAHECVQPCGRKSHLKLQVEHEALSVLRSSRACTMFNPLALPMRAPVSVMRRRSRLMRTPSCCTAMALRNCTSW
jgi:hypothetical protein